MKTYRITGWIGLPKELDQLKYRKALIAMSVGGVTRTWLANDSGLRRSELDALLKLLIAAGVLKAEEGAARNPPPRERPAVSPRTAPAPLEHKPTTRRRTASNPARRFMRAVARFFNRTVHLQRRGVSVEVVLRAASRPVQMAPAPVQSMDERAPMLEGLTPVQVERMGATLSALLDRHAMSRRVAPHLALFEQVLRRNGAEAVDDLPRSLVKRAAQQLHELNGERLDGVLAKELAPRLAAALRERLDPPSAAPDEALRSDFVDPARLEVREVGHSVFLEAREMPATKPPRLGLKRIGTVVLSDHI